MSQKLVSGYSIYNKDVKKRTLHNPLPEDKFYPPLPKTKFDIIYADPPWHYNGVMDLAGNLFGAVTRLLQQTATVLLTMTFILLEATGFPAKLEAALGKEGSIGRFTKVQSEVQRYLGIKAVISLATGILVGSWCAGLDVDFPLVWGLLAFLMNFIPTLGSLLAAVPPVLLALVQFGPGRALAVALGFIFVNLTLGTFIEPHFMGRRFGLSTLVIFLSLIFWGWVWGPIGMLLSVPLTMILKILMENSKDFRWLATLIDARPSEQTPSTPVTEGPTSR